MSKITSIAAIVCVFFPIAPSASAKRIALHAARTATEQFGEIYIIRHAERDCDSCCLNETGWVRAGHLINLVSEVGPKMMFAHNYNGQSCERCAQTVLPAATSLNLVVNHSFPKPGYKCLGICPEHPDYAPDSDAAAAMKEALDSTDGGPIFTAWESFNTYWLLKELGVPNPPFWPYGDCSAEYNRMYKLTFKRVAIGSPGHWEAWRKRKALWVYSSYENLTQGMPCLDNRFEAKAEEVGAPYPTSATFPA